MCFRKEKFEKPHHIDSFEMIKYHMSGMRFIHDHEITVEGEKAVISLYRPIFKHDGGDNERELLCRCELPLTEMLDILNQNMIGLWNGFNGPHPRGVLDGIMFRFEAKVNGGVTIVARGSQNFPSHFYDFTNKIDELLREAEEKAEQEDQ